MEAFLVRRSHGTALPMQQTRRSAAMAKRFSSFMVIENVCMNEKFDQVFGARRCEEDMKGYICAAVQGR